MSNVKEFEKDYMDGKGRMYNGGDLIDHVLFRQFIRFLGKIKTQENSDISEQFGSLVSGVSITGDVSKTLTLTLQNGETLTAEFEDSVGDGVDIKLNSLSWDKDAGVLQAVTSDGGVISENIDGRYALLGHTHTVDAIDGLEERISALSHFIDGSLLALTANTAMFFILSSSMLLYAIELKGNATVKVGSTSGGDEYGELTGNAGAILQLGLLRGTVYFTSDTDVEIVPIIYKR